LNYLILLAILGDLSQIGAGPLAGAEAKERTYIMARSSSQSGAQRGAKKPDRKRPDSKRIGDDYGLGHTASFARIPTVGDYFALEHKGPFYQVKSVLHCAFPGAGHDAEIWAVGVPSRLWDVMDKAAIS
jgi:hypothetical protein